MKSSKKIASLTIVSAFVMMNSVQAEQTNICNNFDYSAFADAVEIAHNETEAFGFGSLDAVGMWATVVNVAGTICGVHSVNPAGVDNTGGYAGNAAWLGSRVISAQKAFTANAFSLDTLSIPSGGVFALVQPGGSLYGLQHSNPVDASSSYSGSALLYGAEGDPLVGKKVGGVNVFGGGFALYDSDGTKVGAVGVSGDTSCRDSAMAYRLRIAMGFNNEPNDDGLTLVADPGDVFQHPECGVADPAPSADDEGPSDYGVRAPA